MLGSTRTREAAVLFGVLSAIYAANGEFVPSNDCTATVFGPVVLLETHSGTLTPQNAPFMFEPPRASPDPAGPLERYYLSTTRWPGHYVNTYGPLPGWLLLAPLALLRLFVGDLREHIAWVWQIAKLCSALLAASSVALLYWTARSFATRPAAAVVAGCFGLGTVVWPMASQTPYQQTFALPFLGLGMLLALGSTRAGMSSILNAGLSFGIAAVVRAPLVFYPACVGLALLWAARREALEWRRAGAFAAGCAIPGVALLAYNLYVFGTWHGSTQLQPLAAAFGGDAWRTPLLTGTLGLLLSPSRGLFVYSPVLLFSIYGAIRTLTRPAWAALRPFVAAAAALSILYAKWSAWWGGWCFGPRLLIDVLPVACILLLPALEGLRASTLGRAAFALTLIAALFNSALGALAYDLVGWDARDGFAVVDPRTGAADLYIDRDKATAAAATRQHTLSVVHMDIDAPQFRYRLWRVRDSPLPYYVANFDAARRQRLRLMERARQLAHWAPALVAK